MAEQYDISPEKRKILEFNAKRRTDLRNFFLKESSNPFKHASGEGGFLFDPALQRYQSMKLSSYEHFRPNPRNVFGGLASCVIPILGYAYYLQTSRAEKERKYRSGEVAYKDRPFKFI